MILFLFTLYSTKHPKFFTYKKEKNMKTKTL